MATYFGFSPELTEALTPLACNNLYHKSFWTHDDVNESCLSSWFAFYRSFVLWPSFNFLVSVWWLVDITKAAASVPSRCQRHGTACSPRTLVCGRSHNHISGSEPLDVNVCTCWEDAIMAAPGQRVPSYHPRQRSAAGTLNITHVPITVAVLFFIDPVCCTDCCKYQTLYFSLLIIQYCNIFNIK